MTGTAETPAGTPWWLGNRLPRTQRNSLTDEQLLARYRHRHGNPYLPLSVAKQLHIVEIKYAHLGAGCDRRRQEEIETQRAQLRRRLFPAVRREDSECS